jgi:dipeptidyl aminopeptidase/acylaminoacyl peptidase
MFQVAAPAMAALMLQAASLDSATAAAVFGARETIQQASLSPDGKRIAYLKPLPGQGGAVFVAALDDLAEPARPAMMVDGEPERLESCRWTGNTRLLCLLYTITTLAGGELAYATRWVAIDPDGENIEVLFAKGDRNRIRASLFGGRVVDWLPDQDGHVLMMREYIPEYINSMNTQSRDGFAVDRIDTRTGKVAIVERARRQVIDYIGDGRGTVRIMGERVTNASGYDKGVVEWSYRRTGSERWEKLGDSDHDGNGFVPAAVDADQDIAYGLKKLDGRVAAYKLALDGSMKETLVFAHPEVDVDGFLSIGRRGRIVGVSYATDRRHAHYFDPELYRLRKSLERAIPKLPLIRFVDASLDENRLLIRAESDTDPGRYFLFDRGKKQLDDMMDVRPELRAVQLAEVRPVHYKAADGTEIPAYLTLPPGKETAKGLPAIVMPHGGPGARDEWGFDWLAQFFANRGYAVLQPNFRGSDG